MAACAICATSPSERVGALCPGCAARIASPEPRAPGIVSSRLAPDQAAAWMIDPWGQLHPVPSRGRIGRDPARNDLIIADLAVSAEHAELRCERGQWSVRDRGSSNGTGVGDRPRIRDAAIRDRDRIWFGSVAFYFWAAAEPPSRDVPGPEVRTLVPDGGAFRLVGPDGDELQVRPARGYPIDRAPGALAYVASAAGSTRAALPRLQYQLLRALCEAAVAAGDDGDAAFVGTRELLATLPFQSSQPEPNHVRQVVATLRATLRRAGAPAGADPSESGVVVASEGLGYRVTWRVHRLVAVEAP